MLSLNTDAASRMSRIGSNSGAGLSLDLRIEKIELVDVLLVLEVADADLAGDFAPEEVFGSD